MTAVNNRIPKRKQINEPDETPTEKRLKSQSVSTREVWLAATAYADYLTLVYTPRESFRMPKKTLGFEAFVDVLPKGFWGGDQNYFIALHTANWTGDRKFKNWRKAVRAVEGILRCYTSRKIIC